jgi:hypothetical protein
MIDMRGFGFFVLAILVVAFAVSTVHDIKNRNKRTTSAIAAFKVVSLPSAVILILMLIVAVLVGGR